MDQNQDMTKENSSRMPVGRELSPWMKEHLLKVEVRNSRMSGVKPALGARTGLLLRRVSDVYQPKSTDPSGMSLSRPFVYKSGGSQPAPSNWGALVLLLSQSRGNTEATNDQGMRPRGDLSHSGLNRQELWAAPFNQPKIQSVPTQRIEVPPESKQRPKSG